MWNSFIELVLEQLEAREVAMPKAVFDGEVIAESEDTIVVEGNHYFPPDSVNAAYLQASSERTVCPWKGVASYHDVVANGKTVRGGAWYYRDPSPAAAEIKDYLAFWRGVKVEGASRLGSMFSRS